MILGGCSRCAASGGGRFERGLLHKRCGWQAAAGAATGSCAGTWASTAVVGAANGRWAFASVSTSAGGEIAVIALGREASRLVRTVDLPGRWPPRWSGTAGR
jgi:hypothetical protein